MPPAAVIGLVSATTVFWFSIFYGEVISPFFNPMGLGYLVTMSLGVVVLGHGWQGAVEAVGGLGAPYLRHPPPWCSRRTSQLLRLLRFILPTAGILATIVGLIQLAYTPIPPKQDATTLMTALGLCLPTFSHGALLTLLLVVPAEQRLRHWAPLPNNAATPPSRRAQLLTGVLLAASVGIFLVPLLFSPRFQNAPPVPSSPSVTAAPPEITPTPDSPTPDSPTPDSPTPDSDTPDSPTHLPECSETLEL